MRLWRESIGNLPNSFYMLAHFLGYKLPERDRPRETMEQAAERLLGSFLNPRSIVSRSNSG